MREREGAAGDRGKAHDREREPEREDQDRRAKPTGAPSPTPQPTRGPGQAPAPDRLVAPVPEAGLDAIPGADVELCAPAELTEALGEAVGPAGDCPAGPGTLTPPRPFDGEDTPDLPPLPPLLQAPAGTP